jgi:hypothetical protein
MCFPWRCCPSHTRLHAGQCVSSFTISQLGVQEGARARVLVVATALSVFLSYMPDGAELFLLLARSDWLISIAYACPQKFIGVVSTKTEI